MAKRKKTLNDGKFDDWFVDELNRLTKGRFSGWKLELSCYNDCIWGLRIDLEGNDDSDDIPTIREDMTINAMRDDDINNLMSAALKAVAAKCGRKARM